MHLLHRIVENTAPILKQFGYHRDNPGGEWLQRKQEHAFERARNRGMSGSITGTLGMRREMMLPVSFLKKFPGARDEDRKPGEAQYDWLMAQVKENGFDNSDSPVLLMVNHRGEGWMWEGNTRVAVAQRLAIPYIHAEVRYWNGGEDADGPCHPLKVAGIAVSSSEKSPVLSGS